MRVFALCVVVWPQLRSWQQDDTAVTAIEYALMAALVAVVIVGAVVALGSDLKDTYDYVANCVKNLSCQA